MWLFIWLYIIGVGSGIGTKSIDMTRMTRRTMHMTRNLY